MIILANERKTEKITRTMLEKAGYTDELFNVEEQQSDNLRIKELLSKASKSGSGKAGYPEFIITPKDNKENIIIIIECKADVTKHQSKDFEDPVNYAVDGALHYTNYLYTDYNVVCIGISGQTKKELKISAYYVKQNGEEFQVLTMPKNKISSYEKLIELFEEKSENIMTEEELMKYANKLHNDLRDYGTLSEQLKPLLISGILLGLKQKSFIATFELSDHFDLAEDLYKAIERQLLAANIPLLKKDRLIKQYEFIKTEGQLFRTHSKLGESPLKYFIREINKKVKPFMEQNNTIDLLGRFYGEFLRYSGGDGKGLGIVLTPTHICNLMAELAGVNKDSIVIDTTTGTSGLLIAAMMKMIEDANGDEEKIAEIKKNQLIGIELQTHMYALACSNMILRGDGKANMHLGSCFEKTVTLNESGIYPTVGIINPPYSQKAKGLSELDFIENLLDTLASGGKGAIIVPMSVAIDCSKNKLEIRKRILEKHTLNAVMSMPDELFYPTSTNTCIMVFTAHEPHNNRKKTWFGYWKDDGFVKTKTEGRIDKYNRYQAIHDQWINDYINQEERPGQCVRACVTASDEWCAEAYLKTDYNNLSINDFEKAMKNYAIFKLMEEGETVENC